jgi:hypothetical protein
VVLVTLLRDDLGEELASLRGLELEIPLSGWAGVVKQLRSDRKLLGGVLLRCVAGEEQQTGLSRAIGHDRLFSELQRVLIDSTLGLIEEGALDLHAPADAGGEREGSV